MAGILDEFEHLLEITLESQIFNWLPAQSSTSDIVKEILVAIQSVYGKNQEQVISSDFMIHVSPEEYAAWFSNQVDLTQFSRLLTKAMTSTGMHSPKPPAFHIIADATLTPGKVSILPVKSSVESGETQHLGFEDKKPVPKLESHPDDEMRAFFTCSNGDVFHLDKPVINIGRREENDIVLADPRVSRQHAQIRRVRNQHILFDLSSTGGTLVNDRPIIQTTLYTGDVVSFGGIIMIYAEETFTISEEDTSDLNGTTRTPTDPSDDGQGLEIL